MSENTFVWDDELVKEFASKYSTMNYSLEMFKESKNPKPLFVTEDGYAAENPEEMLLYVSQYKIREKKAKNMSGLQNKRFKLKEMAEEYILLNKPCLSLNEVVEATEKDRWLELKTNPHYLKLKRLAKEKINK